MRLPRQEVFGEGRWRWEIKVARLTSAELQHLNKSLCWACGYTLNVCPECGSADTDEPIEGFWYAPHRTIYIDKELPERILWWTYRHELWHAINDWFAWRYRR